MVHTFSQCRSRDLMTYSSFLAALICFTFFDVPVPSVRDDTIKYFASMKFSISCSSMLSLVVFSVMVSRIVEHFCTFHFMPYSLAVFSRLQARVNFEQLA